MELGLGFAHVVHCCQGNDKIFLSVNLCFSGFWLGTFFVIQKENVCKLVSTKTYQGCQTTVSPESVSQSTPWRQPEYEPISVFWWFCWWFTMCTMLSQWISHQGGGEISPGGSCRLIIAHSWEVHCIGETNFGTLDVFVSLLGWEGDEASSLSLFFAPIFSPGNPGLIFFPRFATRLLFKGLQSPPGGGCSSSKVG